MKRKDIIMLLSGIIIFICITGWKIHWDSEQKQQEIINTAQDYSNGLKYIDTNKFDKAIVFLSRFRDGKYNNEEQYKDAQVIAKYANARYKEYEPGTYYRTQYEFALRQLDEIPKDYNGKYAADIVSFRGKVQDRLDTYARTDKAIEEERKTKVYIGDSEYKVINILGEPERKNRTAIGNTVREQWVYNNKYIYIENGTVVAWQD